MSLRSLACHSKDGRTISHTLRGALTGGIYDGPDHISRLQLNRMLHTWIKQSTYNKSLHLAYDFDNGLSKDLNDRSLQYGTRRHLPEHIKLCEE